MANEPQTVVVSGGSRGLGLAVCRRLTAEGYRVIAIARNPTDDLAAATRDATPGELFFRPFDLGQISGIAGFVSGLRKEFGTIYGLVNNAALGTSGVLAILPDRQIERLITVNTLSPLVLTKYVVRSMMAAGAGRIVNMASIVGFTGFSGLSAYAATKASMLGFTRSLAREVGQLGITVNAVAPGFIETDMTEGLQGQQRDQIVRRSALRRLAEADDIANTVAFLLSDNAKNITGTVMTIDAGSTA
ncbi:MAG TPA: SDR family NAD(P)-dependent oxidoreductase [Stellaceae bacterium]|nr:SDR family NAD(P)-dependent oxidoreductase [Stellaceae bacterium]